MATIFYDYLIPWEKVETYFVVHEVDGEQRLEVIELIEETVHTETLMVILHHLPTEKHDEFIERFHEAPHDDMHIVFLKKHATPDIDHHIQEKVTQVIDELIAQLAAQSQTE